MEVIAVYKHLTINQINSLHKTQRLKSLEAKYTTLRPSYIQLFSVKKLLLDLEKDKYYWNDIIPAWHCLGTHNVVSF